MATNYPLKAGHTLTATVNEGRAHIRSADGLDNAFTRSSVAFGPYLVDRVFLADGDVAVAVAPYTASINSLITTSAGAPDDAARATLSLNPTGDDNALTATARVYGEEGNSISIAYVDPGGTTAALSVSVFRQAITVSLARAANAITTTAAQLKAAIEADTIANQLVTVAVDATDTGAGDDGSGIVTALAAAPLTGGAGTGIGAVVPGGLLIDTTTGKQYRNAGTQAVPVWVSEQDLHLYGSGAPVDYTDGSPPATGEGTAYPGALYTDTTNANVYRNSGTRAEPAWTQLADVTP